MRILHLSTHDATGGAARAAYRLHDGLRRLGHQSEMLVFGRTTDDPSVHAFATLPGLPRRLARGARRRRIAGDFAPYLSTRPPGLEGFSDDRSEYAGEVAGQLPPCDVVNLHWISGWVDYGALLPRISRDVPIVWTLHDMNAFTGGCHYDGGCGRFVGKCGACPQLGSHDEHDLSRAVWSRKREALSALYPARTRIVADSRWLASEARRSSLLGGLPVSTIHYGLDTDVFLPRGRSAAREVLGIPESAQALLFVADSVENRRKGFPLLVAALKRLAHLRDLFLVSIGRGVPPVPAGIPHLHLSQLSNDHFLSVVYSAADLFVLPSLEEAFGQTALEALACGTPAVGFDAGGIPDVIRPDETGLLAPTGDAVALADAIEQLLRDPDARARMGETGRRIAVAEHGLAVQAGRYASLYAELRDPRGAGGATNAGAPGRRARSEPAGPR